MRVALYARVSTDKQTVDHQVRSLQEWAERHHHEVYKVYKDVVSGGKDSRPAWNELQADMRLYKFQALVVTKLDRVGRSLQHLLSVLDELNRKGIFFITITQSIDTSNAAGRLQMQIMGAFAEFERNLISERTKEGLKGNIRVGKRGKDKKPRKKRGGLKKRIVYSGN